jgi:thermitase
MMELEARAYDASGNIGYSDVVNVTVSNDDSPPEVVIENPVDGSEVSGFVTVDVSATDNGNVAMVSLSIDGEEVEVAYDSTTLSYKWNAKSPGGKGNGKGNGKKSKVSSSAISTLTAVAEDEGGNRSSTTAKVSITK